MSGREGKKLEEEIAVIYIMNAFTCSSVQGGGFL